MMKKSKIDIRDRFIFILSNYICLTLMFILSVMDLSGKLNFIGFLFCSAFMIIINRDIETLPYFIVTLMLNFSLLNGTIKGLSINRLIFLFMVLYVMYLFWHTKCIKQEGFLIIFFLLSWILYIAFSVMYIGHGGVGQVLPITEYILVALAMTFATLNSDKNKDRLIIAYMIGISFIIIIACIELLRGTTFFYKLWAMGNRYRNGILRPGSTVADPNNICFFILPFLFLIENRRFKEIFGKTYIRIMQLLSLLLIFCSSSRAGLVALIVAVSYTVLARQRVYYVLAIPVVAVVTNILVSMLNSLIGQYSSSTEFRHYMVEKGLYVWRKVPLFGVGANNFYSSLKAVDTKKAMVFDSVNMMNTYVFVMVCFGLVGLILYGLYWLLVIKEDVYLLLKCRRVDKDVIFRTAAVGSMLIMVYTLDTFYMIPMWLLPGIYIALKNDVKNCSRERYNE